MNVKCFFGAHAWEEEPPVISGRLVVISIACARCGLRKGKVEKL